MQNGADLGQREPERYGKGMCVLLARYTALPRILRNVHGELQ